MSIKEANKINKAYRTVVTVFAAIMAICALIWNPSHLGTAGLIYAFGCATEIAKADEFDLRE
jgi:hypothetical protein